MTITTTAVGPRPALVISREVLSERDRQDARFGEQNHPDGTGSASDGKRADAARALCDSSTKHGSLTWKEVLDEEVREAFAESDPPRLREELIQVAAVAAAWAEAIDRRATS